MVKYLTLHSSSNPGCLETDVHLVGGETSNEGRVEVCINDEWIPVCGKNWNRNHAAVACRQLAYNGSKWIYIKCNNYDYGISRCYVAMDTCIIIKGASVKVLFMHSNIRYAVTQLA